MTPRPTTSQSAEELAAQLLPCSKHLSDCEDWTLDGIAHLNGCPARYVPAVAAALQAKDDQIDFQGRVRPWMAACFTPEICADGVERGDRLVEEVFELLQSEGYDPVRILALRDYVWGRPAGEPSQEVGGVMVTLAAFCLAHGLDMHAAGETELARIWTKVEKIRAKQASKPTGSALPIPVDDPLAGLRNRISALEAEIERGKGLMREAAKTLSWAVLRQDANLTKDCCVLCRKWVWDDDEEHQKEIEHTSDCLVSRLRAAAGEPREGGGG